MATKELSTEKIAKYEDILKRSAFFSEKESLTKEERIEYKSYALKKVLKLKKYVRN